MSLFDNIGIGPEHIAQIERTLWIDKYFKNLNNTTRENIIETGDIWFQDGDFFQRSDEIIYYFPTHLDKKLNEIPLCPYIKFSPRYLSFSNIDFSKIKEFPNILYSYANSLTISNCKHIEILKKYIDFSKFNNLNIYNDKKTI